MKLHRIIGFAVMIDLAFTLIFWMATQAVDQTQSVEGGAGVIFYTTNETDQISRLDKGIALFNAGKIDHIIIVGGYRPAQSTVGSHDMAQIAIMKGIARQHITTDADSRDTFSNVESARDIAVSSQAQTVVFISDCPHLLRATAVYKQAPTPRPQLYSACSRPSKHPLHLWKRAHYEVGAWALFWLPDTWRERIVRTLR